MTSQTKKYIELSDIIGLRFECKNAECGASLTLPMLEDINRTHPLQKCPNCGQVWVQFADSTYELEFKKLVSTLRIIANAAMGCRFTLEINPETQEVPSPSKRGL
jgi:uncharacterized Zn finger protein